MHNQNQILGTNRTMEVGDACGAKNTCGVEPEGAYCGGRDHPPTIDATLQIRADHNFSTALEAVISGHRITRAGWNARGQYVSTQQSDKFSKMTAPYLYLRNNHGDLVPWVPSQGDLFARDWAVLPIQPL